ncbi:hypothetical protein A3I27_04125 [Candidatus Giovannonibacteria bacterium RIFCSPLOWO2_02_FULL_43_11b]|uniref:Septum formation initiator n=1 Tax=Candidatus Giovannonibacteria bacterium RIFCSPHIGHO2_12_FULL_43_15 TaxID=1798341 RepID=A0A1F5WQL1_9BACT|nr:MAG: hypothetical protein A2739_02105 [Candidatus Giovannonibacteria bacterium RIFCSPHIGHO2_01_FULL_43_100]OGF67116.1 MAG: hypothetical protein A3B97_04240 [Candidatus Giovannonibacteria bacterium RIFCSPHIGHO2_02_FULL_43_32]OGF77962.1 MAG: hypothetical protein A3F23_03940 [Candidatus Giovannonibacteria bacterium RIFCSPHIGHO2_12_FULL_43_15]OGF79314.1 MAG: hypothetical protein A3A15_01585 [Candidatus Giovannonibacteria bacterium RIFCSPLOWO2_01_FULL_43_60]OGF89290.1 MAG: hypothetical protein A3
MRSRAVLFFLSFLVLFLFVTSIKMSIGAYQASKARKVSEEEYQALTDQKAHLDKKIEDLNDDEVLEKEAKIRFNATLPGEKVLIIVEHDSSGLNIEAKPASIWESIKNFFRLP